MKTLSNTRRRSARGFLRLERPWRLFATAVGFTLFALGCLAVTAIAIPSVWLTRGAAPVRRLWVRKAIGTLMRGFLALVTALGALTYEVSGASRLGRPGQLILANHPTLIDGIFLLACAPSSSCIVKQALWQNLLTRWPLVAAGYVSNNPTDRMIEETSSALRAGQSVIIFPEGTRSVPGRPLHLERGAAAIAVRAATVVTPVYIRCSPPMLAKGDPWHRIPERRAHFSLEVGADIDPEPFRRNAPTPIAARELNERLVDALTALGRRT